MREADALVSALVQLVPHLPSDLVKSLFSWIDQVCREQPLQQVVIAKSLIQLLLRAAQDNDIDVVCSSVSFSEIDPIKCLTLAKDVHIELKDVSDNETQARGTYSLVNPSTVLSVVFVTLSFSEMCIDELEWIIAFLAAQAATDAAAAEFKEEHHSNERAALESAMVARIMTMITFFAELAQSCIIGLQAETLLKSFVRLYKLLATLTKHVHTTWPAPSTRFQKLVDQTGRHLTDYVYAFVNFCQNGEDAEESSARIARQQKIVPALVFSIEQYQKNLIQLSKSSTVNLMRSFKRSIARDFKIKADILEQQQEEAEDAPMPDAEQPVKVSNELIL